MGAMRDTDHAARLAALRASLAALGVDGLIVPRGDEQLGENVPDCAERLRWLTGFSGSAGVAVVLADRAGMFSDGRYILQMDTEVDGALFERLHVTDNPPPAWITAHAQGQHLRLGYDPRVISESAVEPYESDAVTLVALAANPIDALWTDRPAAPTGAARLHPERRAGRDSASKLDEIAAGLRDAREDAAVVTDTASVAWLLNIRGTDLATTPVVLGFVVVHADGHAELFTDPAKFDADVRASLGNRVVVAPVAALDGALAGLAGKRVRVDRENTPAFFAQTLKAAGATVTAGADPCLTPKSRKTAAEQQGMRDAHARDARALCRFLHWLDGRTEGETELSAAARLRDYRAAEPGFLGVSFDTIAAAGPNGAIMHYHPTEATNRAIRAGEMFLIDSGGQYDCGTTDVTRTVWMGSDEAPDGLREQFTRVLKGHIAIATAVFPVGTTGHRLDILARLSLWQAGLDFDHGTGHGVGSLLSVHEGPVNISPIFRPAPIELGNVISDEPGFYLPGSHGIRIENLLLVRDAAIPGAMKPFLLFETLTLAPIDRRCIDTRLLNVDERAWVDAYHARVWREVGPLLEGEARDWLERACAAL